MADKAEDEAAIRKAVEQLFAAMHKHDAKAYGALCAENFETWEGDVKGRAAMEKLMSDTFATAKDIQFELLDEIGIVFAAPDVAIYKHTDKITGALDDDEEPLPPFKRLSARVFVKQNGNWLFATHFYRTIEESSK
jgi:ketosteroid isomerase-like protein